MQVPLGKDQREFQGKSSVFQVISKLQAHLEKSCYSHIPNFCPHLACVVLHTPDTVVHYQFSSFQEHLTLPECVRLFCFFLVTHKYLSIVFLISHFVSAQIFSMFIRFCLKFCFHMNTQQKTTFFQLSSNKNL